MRVKAIMLGYYDHKRRREGEVFHLLSEKDFSKKWMLDLDGASKGAKSKKKSKPEKEEVVPVNTGSIVDTDVI